MADPVFFAPETSLSVEEIATLTGARPAAGADPALRVSGVAPLDAAGPNDLTFLDGPRYLPLLAATRAAVCLTVARHAPAVPAGVTALETPKPYEAYVAVLRRLYPAALRPAPILASGISPAAHIDPTARLEEGATVEAGAVVGAGAEIGRGTIVGPGAVIGPGVRIGQDGFGYLMGAQGHAKVPQVGRVVIQDDVEIGANTTIDRGANRDTVIGEGTKIDNQVQIGHNVVIGRHCIIVSQVGLSGSATLGDFVALGGQAGVVGHVTVGHGAQIAATSSVKDDVPPGGRWGGTPARPLKEWYREELALRRLAQRALKSAPREEEER